MSHWAVTALQEMRTQATFDDISLSDNGTHWELASQLGSQYFKRLGTARASKIPNKTAAVVRAFRKLKQELAVENAA